MLTHRPFPPYPPFTKYLGRVMVVGWRPRHLVRTGWAIQKTLNVFWQGPGWCCGMKYPPRKRGNHRSGGVWCGSGMRLHFFHFPQEKKRRKRQNPDSKFFEVLGNTTMALNGRNHQKMLQDDLPTHKVGGKNQRGWFCQGWDTQLYRGNGV